MTDEDVAGAARVMATAFGIDPRDEESSRRGRERVAHLLHTDPDGCFVGEREGRIVGVAQAYRRDRLWCLSMLAVDPGAQSDGMGRELFEQTLAYGDRGPGLIVGSNDPRALRLYAAEGFSLRPAMEAHGTLDRRAIPPRDRAVTFGGAADLDALEPVSRAIRGAPHTPEVAFSLRRGARLLRYGDRGFAVAEAGVGVWLLAALDERAASALLWAALDVAGDVQRPVRWITGGQDWAVDVVVRAGLQLTAYGALCVRGDPGPLWPFLPSPPFA
jgi:GNAT superfamily N-acetyltransferase